MITLSLLLFALFVGGMLYLGLGLVFTIVALFFKALWLGVNFVFSLGWLAVVLAATAVVLLIKLSGVFLLVAMVAAVLWVFWLLGRLIGGSRRSAPAAPYYACEPPRGGYGCGSGGSKREETINRIHRTLGKMERRMRDLEEEMERRWR